MKKPFGDTLKTIRQSIEALAIIGTACARAYDPAAADIVPPAPDAPADQAANFLNNTPAPFATINAALAIAVMRTGDEAPDDEEIQEAMENIADWDLDTDESTVAQLLANATWAQRNADRGLVRLTSNKNNVPWDQLDQDVKDLDKNQLQAAAKAILEIVAAAGEE